MNDIEKQLHEQYAINANNNVTTMVSIAAVLLSVVGSYGYVFIHTEGLGLCNNPEFTQSGLIVTASVALLTLSALFCISGYLGTNQRLEQFIIHRIRCKCYDGSESIFPSKYNPFGKCFFGFIQGLHYLSMKIYFIASLLISVFTYRAYNEQNCCVELGFVFLCILLLLICSAYYYYLWTKYNNRKEEYSSDENRLIAFKNKTNNNENN